MDYAAGRDLGLLLKSQRHLSAKEVYGLLQASNSDIGIATVYRTLDLLDKASLVRKIQCRDGQLRYEYKRGDQSDHHHHLICTDCGIILNYRDFEKEELDTEPVRFQAREPPVHGEDCPRRCCCRKDGRTSAEEPQP